MHITRRRFMTLAAGGLAASALGPMRDAYGTPAEDPWRWGMSVDLSGSAQRLGQGMRAGVEAAIREINDQGGLLGRPITLIALDDGYEPSRAAPNVHRLIDQERVFAIVGNVGTPTAAVAAPIANQKETVFWGAFTGAGLLRKDPPDPFVFNFRASYAEETAQMVGGLIDGAGLKPEELGFFTQNDAYGDSGYAGAIQALKARGYHDAPRLPHGRYTRNTLDVEDALATLLDPRYKTRAVIMVGTAAPCAKLVRLAKQHSFEARMLAVSFVGADALLEQLGPQLAQDVIVMQVVPHPERSDLPMAQRFRRALPDQAARSFVSLEGYIAAHALAEAIRLSGLDHPDARAFVQRVHQPVSLDLGLGKTFNLSARERQLCHLTWPTIIDQGQILPLERWAPLPSTR